MKIIFFFGSCLANGREALRRGLPLRQQLLRIARNDMAESNRGISGARAQAVYKVSEFRIAGAGYELFIEHTRDGLLTSFGQIRDIECELFDHRRGGKVGVGCALDFPCQQVTEALFAIVLCRRDVQVFIEPVALVVAAVQRASWCGLAQAGRMKIAELQCQWQIMILRSEMFDVTAIKFYFPAAIAA